jgi:hypothetical protein
MRWSDLSYKCNNQEVSSGYLTTLRKASLSVNSAGVASYICTINQKVFSLPDWIRDNNINSKDVDCMFVKCSNGNYAPNQVFLIEFKGGKTIYDWDYGTIRFKIFDSLHCALPRLLNKELWPLIFDESCELVFVLALSSKHSIIEFQVKYDEVNCPRNKIKSNRTLVKINKLSNELKELKKRLLKYSGLTPFSYVRIIEAKNFSIENPRGYYYDIKI